MYDIDPILWHCHSMPEKNNGDHVLARWFGNWLPLYFENYSIRLLHVHQQCYWSRHVMTIELQINHNELAITIIIVPHRIDVYVHYHNFPLLMEEECGWTDYDYYYYYCRSHSLNQPSIHSFIHSFTHAVQFVLIHYDSYKIM